MKLKVLCVDDNQEFCQNIKDILEMEGYEVFTAADGMDAIDFVSAECPGLVLMDVRLPEMDGVATFRRIKSLRPEVPVLMMTAYAVEDRIKAALREGAFGSMRKPIDIRGLLSLIRDLGKDGSVLVVDDDRAFCANLCDIIGGKGYSVSVAYDGESAVEKVWERSFDLILMDMKLPSFNGLEAFLAIKDIRPEANVVMITGYPREMAWLAQQAVQEDARTWLEKPIDLPMLETILEGSPRPRLKRV